MAPYTLNHPHFHCPEPCWGQGEFVSMFIMRIPGFLNMVYAGDKYDEYTY